METARIVIIETPAREMTVTLRQPLDIWAIWDQFRAKGLHPVITLALGVARVTF